MEALAGFIRQFLKGGELDVAAAVPADLIGKIVGFVPIILGGLGQLLQIVAGNLKAHILRQGTGVVIHAPHGHMQQVDTSKHRQHPAKPLDWVPFQNNHQHEAGKNQNAKHHRQQLPHGVADLGGPVCQNILQGAHNVGVDHVHQLRVALAELRKHPGQRGENSGSQVAKPIFQRKPSFCVSLS